MTSPTRAARWGATIAPIALAVVVAVVLLLLAGANPLESFKLMGEGAFSGWTKTGITLMAWVPLVLAAAGLIITFNAGLWNIGIEGQIILGGIAASWAAREVGGPGWVVVPTVIVVGALGGMLWALLAGVLKTRFKVNEIFGGLGLDFVAASLAVYLVIGPWSRQGVASTSGTDLFRDEALLPTVSENNKLSLVAIALAIAAVIFVFYLMKGTLFGLRLKAVGRNARSAFLLGIPTTRYMLGAFALCGLLAGIAGAMQAIGFHFKLIPAISGGYGFLGILVVMLAAFRAAWIAPIALFFVVMSRGSTQLDLRLSVDSALGGVITGILVLLVIMGGGWQLRRRLKREAPA